MPFGRLRLSDMKRRVQQVFEGEWTQYNWKQTTMCCDCLLVHEIEYRVRKNKLQLRIYRNNRSTAAFRRAQGIKVMVKKK